MCTPWSSTPDNVRQDVDDCSGRQGGRLKSMQVKVAAAVRHRARRLLLWLRRPPCILFSQARPSFVSHGCAGAGVPSLFLRCWPQSATCTPVCSICGSLNSWQVGLCSSCHCSCRLLYGWCWRSCLLLCGRRRCWRSSGSSGTPSMSKGYIFSKLYLCCRRSHLMLYGCLPVGLMRWQRLKALWGRPAPFLGGCGWPTALVRRPPGRGRLK